MDGRRQDLQRLWACGKWEAQSVVQNADRRVGHLPIGGILVILSANPLVALGERRVRPHWQPCPCGVRDSARRADQNRIWASRAEEVPGVPRRIGQRHGNGIGRHTAVPGERDAE